MSLLSIPAQALRANLAAWAPRIEPDAVVVSSMKGVETYSGLRMSEVIHQVTGIPFERIAVLSGPNLAREIAGGQPAASVIACPDETAAAALQKACHTPYFRPYTRTDVAGCDLGGAIKNVIALAVGLTAGLGMGGNARALLVTRGLAETARLGQAMGADPLTFSGLAGAGDLIATCSSPLSRNRNGTRSPTGWRPHHPAAPLPHPRATSPSTSPWSAPASPDSKSVLSRRGCLFEVQVSRQLGVDSWVSLRLMRSIIAMWIMASERWGWVS